MQRVKEIDYALAEGVLQVEFFTLGDLLPTLHEICGSFVDVLQEILGGCFEQQDLIVVVSVMAQITAFLADQFIMKTAVSNVSLSMVRAEISSARILLIGLSTWEELVLRQC